MTLLFDDSPPPEHGLTWSGVCSGMLMNCRNLWRMHAKFWTVTVISVVRLLGQTVCVLAQEGLRRINSNVGFWHRSGRGAQTASGNLAIFPILHRTAHRMPMYKVHGALGERWTKDAGGARPIRLSLGKQNPWVAAEIRNVRIPVTAPKPEEPEIRGLDDIFTVPVQGSFLDVIQPAERSEGRRKLHGLKPAITPIRSDWELKEPSEPAVSREHENERAASLAEKHQRLSAETHKLSKRVKRVAASTQDWFSRQEAMLADVSEQLSRKVPAPYQSYASEDEGIYAPVPPPLQVIQSEKAASVNHPDASQNQAAIQVAALSLEEAPTLLPQGELSAFDYMLQNNRILSRSISNLVERYFDQNALSEDSA